MNEYFEDDPSLYDRKPDYKGVNWNGLIFAPILHVFILLLPHLSNYIKERQLRHHLASTRQQKEELLQLKKELSTISMTDEFARHAKLQRRINALQDVLTMETTEATNKATADKNKFHSACYGSLVFSQIIMIMYHRSSPLFILPVQWFGPINWIISFPTGIDGAVGFTFWLFTCRRILNSIHQWIFPAPKKDDAADSTMLSNLMNSMMGAKPGSTPGGFPGAFPGMSSPPGTGMPALGPMTPFSPPFSPAFSPASDFSAGLSGGNSRESSPESLENMIVPALD